MDTYQEHAKVQTDRAYVGNGSIMAPGILGQVQTGQPELARAIDTAQAVHHNLTETAELLSRHLDRILGPTPEESALASGNPISGDSDIDRLHLNLRIADSAAYRIRNQVERLARL